jgi:hypothetical protein
MLEWWNVGVMKGKRNPDFQCPAEIRTLLRLVSDTAAVRD